MVIVLTFVHVLVSAFLIVVVLLQTGKRADLAGAFGGGGSQTAFGARGAATFLSKATTISAVIFMVTSLALSLYSSHSTATSGTVLDKANLPSTSAPAPSAPPAPAAPQPAAPQAPATPPSN